MKDIIVAGAGRIGGVIALMLAESGSYRVLVADRDQRRLDAIPPHSALATARIECANRTSLVAALKGKFAVLSALPFHLTQPIAEAALTAGTHYLDLTEDVAAAKKIAILAQQAEKVFIPQCGLAPGFVSIVAQDLARGFDRLDSIRMRVGALPQFPSNGLNYNLTWSIDGLINEYIEPCEAISEGKLVIVPALEEREEFSLDGVTYEAFNTSGGLGTLAKTLEGRVRTMNYRTIRYPGHQAIIKLLLQDLNLKNRRDVLKDLFEQSLPVTAQDVVILFVTVCGWREGQYLQETYANKIYPNQVSGKRVSAIQITTAAGICTLLDLLAEGKLTHRGLIRQEEIRLTDFLGNRFGQIYDPAIKAIKEAI